MTVHSHEPALEQFPPASSPLQPVGIGLRHAYYREVIDQPPAVGWMEIHPENYFGGGVNRHFLTQIRKNYQISFHAVGLSLGSDQPVREQHLQKMKELIDIFDPFQISDHASWSASGNAHLNDLLPLPYTQETLDALCRNIDRTQNFFGRKILVENPSTYIAFADNEMSEYEFLNRASHMTGCSLLLDINNIYVQAHNHGLDPYEYVAGIDAPVKEMHLAGHTEKQIGDTSLLIDTHNKPVRNEVWDLYEFAVRQFGAVPTLIEWDQDFPPLSTLVAEAHKAEDVMIRVLREGLSYAAE